METSNPAGSRMLVAFDHAAMGSTVLRSAVRLAEMLRAELQGLFIEDINLINMAGLPFSREVVSGTGVMRSVDSISIRRTLRLQAEHIRHNLLMLSGEAQVQCSFSTICSERISEIYSAMERVDVVMTAGETARQEAAGNNIVTVFADAMLDAQTLITAQQLAAQNHCPLRVIVPAAGGNELEQQALQLLAQGEGEIYFRREHDMSPRKLARILVQEQGMMLVVRFVSGDKAALRELLAAVQRPVVFIK